MIKVGNINEEKMVNRSKQHFRLTANYNSIPVTKELTLLFKLYY